MVQRYDTQIRQQQIIRATLKIVAQRGISGLTTAEIAREVGIAEGTIFRHFASKNEILLATVRYIRDTLLGWSQDRVAGGGEPLEKLGDILHFHLELFEQNSGIPKIIFSEQVHLHDEKLRQLMSETIGEYMELMGTIIREGMEKGQFKPDLDVFMVVAAYLGLVQVSLLRWSLGGCQSSLTESHGRILHFLSAILQK